MPGTRPCIHWASFKCNYGSACDFSHSGPGGPDPSGRGMLATLKAVGPSVGLAKYKTKFCTHWQLLKCNYGDSCSFSHDCVGGPSERGVHPSVLQAQAPAGSVLSPELLEAAGLGAGSLDAAVLQILGATPDQLTAAFLPQIGPASPPPLRQAAPTAKVKTKLCTHWQQFKCNYGDACNFSHACAGGPSDRGVYPGVRTQAEATSGATGLSQAELLASLAIGASADPQPAADALASTLADALAGKLSPEALASLSPDVLASLAASQFAGHLQVDEPQPPPTGWAGVSAEEEPAQHARRAVEQRVSEQPDPGDALSQPEFMQALEEQVDAAVNLLKNPIVQRMMAARGLHAPPVPGLGAPIRPSRAPGRNAPY